MSGGDLEALPGSDGAWLSPDALLPPASSSSNNASPQQAPGRALTCRRACAVHFYDAARQRFGQGFQRARRRDDHPALQLLRQERSGAAPLICTHHHLAMQSCSHPVHRARYGSSPFLLTPSSMTSCSVKLATTPVWKSVTARVLHRFPGASTIKPRFHAGSLQRALLATQPRRTCCSHRCRSIPRAGKRSGPPLLARLVQTD